MAQHDLVVIGASAGGVEAMRKLAAALPAKLDAALFLVIHTLAEGPALMADILNYRGTLPASYPNDGESFERGHVYIAPPDHHLLLEGERVRVVRGPKENRHRPAIDPLFRSAAVQHGPRVIGVVLSGYLDDGVAGLAAIKQLGGITVVQHPKDAAVPDMPANALRCVAVDHCVPLAELAPLLERLVASPTTTPLPTEQKLMASHESLKIEARIPLEGSTIEIVDRLGTRSVFTCPECHGVLWEIKDNELLRYRCHVGHAFTAESLAEDQQQVLDGVLWMALKSLKERAELSLQMAERARSRGDESAAKFFVERAEKAVQHAVKLQNMLAEEA